MALDDIEAVKKATKEKFGDDHDVSYITEELLSEIRQALSEEPAVEVDRLRWVTYGNSIGVKYGKLTWKNGYDAEPWACGTNDSHSVDPEGTSFRNTGYCKDGKEYGWISGY